jgi:hypothetical protein
MQKKRSSQHKNSFICFFLSLSSWFCFVDYLPYSITLQCMLMLWIMFTFYFVTDVVFSCYHLTSNPVYKTRHIFPNLLILHQFGYLYFDFQEPLKSQFGQMSRWRLPGTLKKSIWANEYKSTYRSLKSQSGQVSIRRPTAPLKS